MDAGGHKDQANSVIWKQTQAPIVARLRHALDQHRLPGLAVVIRQQNEDLFAGGLGFFDAAGQRPVDGQTQFGVASLSKLLTAMLLLLLEERGDLSVDDLLVQHCPSLRAAQRVPITLAHLLSHSAGLPGLPGRFYARNIDDVNDRSGGVGPRGNSNSSRLHAGFPDFSTILEATELVELINQLDVDLLAPPGEILNYSNEGFCLLGGVIESTMRRPYTELVREMIFAPLGMNNSYFGRASLEPSAKIALPLLRDGSSYRAADFWPAPLFYPAGGCISSACDIARLIGALADYAPLLSQGSKERLAQLQMPVASRPYPGIGYSFGLEFQQIDAGTTMLWHSGQRAGVSSFMGWLVEQQMSVSVLCNVADAQVTGIAHQLIGDVLGRSEICWPPAMLTRRVNSIAPERFSGQYASDEGNHFVIEQIDHALVLTCPSAPQARRLHFAGSDHGTVGPQTFRFLSVSTQSEPWALALDLRVLRRVD